MVINREPEMVLPISLYESATVVPMGLVKLLFIKLAYIAYKLKGI
jgi:hypothetical protein